MLARTERLQVLVSKPELHEIRRLARKTGYSLSALVRESLLHFSFWKGASRKRHAAFERLVRLNAPVGDWKQIKRELEARYRD